MWLEMKITLLGRLEITMKRKVFFRSQNLVKETSVSQNDIKITIISGEVRAETNDDIFPTKRLHLYQDLKVLYFNIRLYTFLYIK